MPDQQVPSPLAGEGQDEGGLRLDANSPYVGSLEGATWCVIYLTYSPGNTSSTCFFATWRHDMGMELETNTIHLYQLDLTELAGQHGQCLSVLNADEQARAARYKVDAPRETFILVRGALRHILADYICLPPAEVPFGITVTGKPGLDAPYENIHFNVSHTQGLALIAVANMPLGVDVERVLPLDDLSSIARRYFSTHEWQQLSQLNGEEQLTAFYRVWTRKEAYIKARGDGLGYPLADFDVDCGSVVQRVHGDQSPCYKGFRPMNGATDELSNLLLEDRHDSQATYKWHIQTVVVPAEYTAALAVHSPSALPVVHHTVPRHLAG